MLYFIFVNSRLNLCVLLLDKNLWQPWKISVSEKGKGNEMPPKQTITKQKIVEAAFMRVQQKGKTALSARNIAQALSCSTQPIYSCFSNMKDLEDAVLTFAYHYITRTYLTGNAYAKEPFFSMGLGYIQMVREDPHLFDFIYLSNRTGKIFGKDGYPSETTALLDAMKTDSMLSTLSRETLLDILGHMWIYTHGLAILVRHNPEFSQALIHERLHEMGKTLILSRLNPQGTDDHEFFCHKCQPEN